MNNRHRPVLCGVGLPRGVSGGKASLEGEW